MEPCKRTPRRRAVGEKKGNELIYFHKSMGKILFPSEIRADLESSCKMILPLSKFIWPHSATQGSEVTVPDLGG